MVMASRRAPRDEGIVSHRPKAGEKGTDLCRSGRPRRQPPQL